MLFQLLARLISFSVVRAKVYMLSDPIFINIYVELIISDISFPAVVGTVEELGASQQSMSLVRDQFETNYFGPVNITKAVLPQMRRQKCGHILNLSAVGECRPHFFLRLGADLGKLHISVLLAWGPTQQPDGPLKASAMWVLSKHPNHRKT